MRLLHVRNAGLSIPPFLFDDLNLHAQNPDPTKPVLCVRSTCVHTSDVTVPADKSECCYLRPYLVLTLNSLSHQHNGIWNVNHPCYPVSFSLHPVCLCPWIHLVVPSALCVCVPGGSSESILHCTVYFSLCFICTCPSCVCVDGSFPPPPLFLL